jgi:hypothetical protein
LTGVTTKRDDELTRVLDESAPAAFDRLTAAQRKQLAGHVRSALERQQAAIDEAEEKVLAFLPRALRGPVRKILSSGR